MPTRNRAHILLRAIGSALDQGFTDFELIVVDDASTDGTAELVAGISDPRLVYVRRDKAGGAAAARNSGIRRAVGEYVAFLDDDDEYLPTFLEETHAILKDAPESVGFSWCGVRTVLDRPDCEQTLSEIIWQPRYVNREEAYISFLYSRRVGTGYGLVVRRACFATVGLFEETLSKAEDTEFLLRLVRSWNFVVVPKVLVKVHRHDGPRLTVHDEKMAQAYEFIIARHAETLQQHRPLWTRLHYKTAWLFYHSGKISKAREHMQLAVGRDPLHPKIWAVWLIMEVFGRLGPRIHTWGSRTLRSVRR